MRLYQVTSAATERLAYDGLDRIAEYACPDPCGGNGSNTLQRRYVHGPGMDEPIVWYEGSGTTDRRFLSSDERGSIVSVTDNSGALLGLNKYDEYGNPQSPNLGAWGYTGQAWLPTMGIWYYKARDYDPELGRFLQTDPIGYEGGINLYAYVRNDPVNAMDATGTQVETGCTSRINIACYSQDGGATAISSTGGTPSGGGGVQGGPLNGLPCNSCLSPEDKRAQDSIDFWGGYYQGYVWVSTRETTFNFGRWFTTPTRHDITGTSFCWKACGPNGLEQYPTYSPADQAQTAAAVGVLFGSVLTAPAWLGPNSALFGRGGLLNNNDYIRLGWGPGRGATRQDFYMTFGLRTGRAYKDNHIHWFDIPGTRIVP